MTDIKSSLSNLMALDGAKGCSIVDYESGMTLGKEGLGIDLDLAGAGNSEVIRAKFKTMKSLGITGDIEDILISLSDQLHIIRPTAGHTGLFIYLVLDKNTNLALARRKVLEIEKSLEI